MKHRLLIVDDNFENLNSTAALAERWGYDVETANSGNEAIAKLKEVGSEFSVILLDYQMPEKNGAQTVSEIRSFNDESIILMYSAFRDPDKIISSIRAGSADFIEKSENVSYLRQALENAGRKYEDTTRLTKYRVSESAGTELLNGMGIIGRSRAMIDVGLQIQKFRNSPHNVRKRSGKRPSEWA